MLSIELNLTSRSINNAVWLVHPFCQTFPSSSLCQRSMHIPLTSICQCHQKIRFLSDKRFFPPSCLIPSTFYPLRTAEGQREVILRDSTTHWHAESQVYTPRGDRVLLTPAFPGRSSAEMLHWQGKLIQADRLRGSRSSHKQISPSFKATRAVLCKYADIWHGNITPQWIVLCVLVGFTSYHM